jgi:hypothetical protein
MVGSVYLLKWLGFASASVAAVLVARGNGSWTG